MTRLGSSGPLRVLRVITTVEPHVGGPSYSAVNAAIAEQNGSTRTTIVSTDGPEHRRYTPPGLAEAGVRHVRFARTRFAPKLAARWGLSFRYAAWILLAGKNYDVIHVHYVWSLGTVSGIATGVLWGRPVVMTPHESLTDFDIQVSRSSARTFQKRVVRRLMLSNIQRVVVASELERVDSRLDRNNSEVVAHPVPLPEIPTKRSPSPGNRSITVGFLGRLHEKKRIDVLMDAMRTLDADAGVQLHVGGNQPTAEFDRLVRLVSDTGLGNRVTFAGFVSADTRAEFFSRLDVLAMPSTYECFGMVAAEAMSAGLPVVVTSTTGVADVVRRRGAGLVIPAGDVQALHAAIVRMSQSPNVRLEMGVAAREAALDEFSFAAYRSKIHAVYAGVTSRRARRSG